jgi:outer membrane protein
VPKRTTSPTCCIVLVIALFAASLVWRSEQAGASEGPTIAVLNVELVIRRSKAGQDLQSQIEKIQSANRATDRQTEEALRAEDQKLRKQRAVLSDEAFNEKQRDLQARLEDLRQKFEARRKRIQAAVDKAWSQIRDAMILVTEGLASERKIDVVIAQSSTVLLAKDLNITKDVLKGLNEKLTQVTLTVEEK